MVSDIYLNAETHETYRARLESSRDPVTGRFKKGNGYPGRKKGSLNKRRPLLDPQGMDERKTSGMVAIDPIEALARIGLDDQCEARMRLSAWKALARYIYPQRKAIDDYVSAQAADTASLRDTELEAKYPEQDARHRCPGTSHVEDAFTHAKEAC